MEEKDNGEEKSEDRKRILFDKKKLAFLNPLFLQQGTFSFQFPFFFFIFTLKIKNFIAY